MAATVEQVRREIKALLVRLKDTKKELKDLKEEWPSLTDKDQKTEWTKRRDRIDSIRSELKQDRQALSVLVNSNEDLKELQPEILELMEY